MKSRPWQVLHIVVLVMNRLSTAEFAIFIYSLRPKDLIIQNLFISTAAGIVPVWQS